MDRTKKDCENVCLDGKNIRLNPGPLVHHVLDGDTDLAQSSGQLCDASGPVTDGHSELDQTTVGGQASLKTTAQEGGGDVAAAQENNDAKENNFSK